MAIIIIWWFFFDTIYQTWYSDGDRNEKIYQHCKQHMQIKIKWIRNIIKFCAHEPQAKTSNSLLLNFKRMNVKHIICGVVHDTACWSIWYKLESTNKQILPLIICIRWRKICYFIAILLLIHFSFFLYFLRENAY